MTSQECIQRKTDTDTEIALGFILTELRKGKWRIIIVEEANQVSTQKLVGAAAMVLQLAAQCTQCSWLRRQSATGAALDLRRLTWVIGQQPAALDTVTSHCSWEDHWAGSTRSAMQIRVHNDKRTSFLLIAVH